MHLSYSVKSLPLSGNRSKTERKGQKVNGKYQLHEKDLIVKLGKKTGSQVEGWLDKLI